jgi:hypothetical protein
VKDSQGPVGGATIAVQVGGTTYSNETGLNGMASLNVPDGTYTIHAMKDGYIQNSIEINSGTSNATITLERIFGISGTIVDASTGLPVKGASITISNKASQDYYSGSSDANGVFNVQVPNGYYGITVRDPDYRLSTRDNNGAGYQVLNNALYVGYIPIALLNDETQGLEGVKLVTDFPGKTVKANESVTFDVTIKNDGIVDKTYQLAVKDAPKDWDVQFFSGSDEINKVFVESKSSKTFQVKTTPITSGSNSITIMAAAASDNCSLQLFVDTANESGYGLELYCPDNITLNTGASQNVEVTIKNNGSVKLTNVMLSIDDVPSALTADVTTNKLDELAPGASKKFTISVAAKADAGQESDRLYMHAVSSETKTGQQFIGVNIVKSSTWVGVGIAIALIAILAFGFIVWKYGRR